ncbi:hypothetical protein GCM10017600_04740 [Streptosporangium carneum]|uniref:Uncharacterized protein n=1 Tax=Streptosporangium carneum TaxID=47481 RepID=A0A9W6HX97_9ACTN|nr:hypothetical protein GCM10017600_04740 [Streptosporangium carneum]
MLRVGVKWADVGPGVLPVWIAGTDVPMRVFAVPAPVTAEILDRVSRMTC